MAGDDLVIRVDAADKTWLEGLVAELRKERQRFSVVAAHLGKLVDRAEAAAKALGGSNGK